MFSQPYGEKKFLIFEKKDEFETHFPNEPLYDYLQSFTFISRRNKRRVVVDEAEMLWKCPLGSWMSFEIADPADHKKRKTFIMQVLGYKTSVGAGWVKQTYIETPLGWFHALVPWVRLKPKAQRPIHVYGPNALVRDYNFFFMALLRGDIFTAFFDAYPNAKLKWNDYKDGDRAAIKKKFLRSLYLFCKKTLNWWPCLKMS